MVGTEKGIWENNKKGKLYMSRTIIRFIKKHDGLYSFAVNIKTGKIVNDFLVRHDKLYAIVKCITHLSDTKYIGLLKGYYEKSDEYVTILIEHRGEKHPDKVIYDVRFAVPDGKRISKIETGGFCAFLRTTLLSWTFPDAMGMTPAVELGRGSCYYDSGMDSVTKNVYEYYFEPVAQIPHDEVLECKHVIEEMNPMSSFFFLERASDMFASYQVEQEEIDKLGYLYKKYVRLNQKTKKYIENSLSSLLIMGGVLAVHVRGTDFNWGAAKHPQMITPEEYLAKAKEIYSKGRYKKIFLATDDANALKLFKEEFKENLLYYEDTIRSENHIGVQNSKNDRPLHHYKLGLEVLRDTYTLASCDSLLCGLSQVSFTARYINVALGRSFKELVILDKGINATASKQMRWLNDALWDALKE